MANGDAAAAQGMDTVPGTDDRRDGYDEINKTRDYLAEHETDGTHAWDKITGKPSTYPPSAHSEPWDKITGKPSTYPPSAHHHSASDITSGVLPLERGGTNASSLDRVENVGTTSTALVAWNGTRMGRAFGPVSNGYIPRAIELRGISVGTSGPSGGSDGDIYLQAL